MPRRALPPGARAAPRRTPPLCTRSGRRRRRGDLELAEDSREGASKQPGGAGREAGRRDEAPAEASAASRAFRELLYCASGVAPGGVALLRTSDGKEVLCVHSPDDVEVADARLPSAIPTIEVECSAEELAALTGRATPADCHARGRRVRNGRARGSADAQGGEAMGKEGAAGDSKDAGSRPSSRTAAEVYEERSAAAHEASAPPQRDETVVHGPFRSHDFSKLPSERKPSPAADMPVQVGVLVVLTSGPYKGCMGTLMQMVAFRSPGSKEFVGSALVELDMCGVLSTVDVPLDGCRRVAQPERAEDTPCEL